MLQYDRTRFLDAKRDGEFSNTKPLCQLPYMSDKILLLIERCSLLVCFKKHAGIGGGKRLHHRHERVLGVCLTEILLDDWRHNDRGRGQNIPLV